MRIESRGVDITDVPGVERITVERDSMVINMESKIGRYGIDQVRAIRDALTAALAEHDTMTTATEPAETRLVLQHGDAVLRLGQVLTGDEDLPVGAVVRDEDGDRWHCLKPGRYSMRSDNRDPRWSLADVVDNYSGVTIVSLP